LAPKGVGAIEQRLQLPKLVLVLKYRDAGGAVQCGAGRLKEARRKEKRVDIPSAVNGEKQALLFSCNPARWRVLCQYRLVRQAGQGLCRAVESSLDALSMPKSESGQVAVSVFRQRIRSPL